LILLDSLAFIPLDEVKNGMEYLKQNILIAGAEDFLIYFETTYVNGSFKRIGIDESKIRLRRIPPFFHIIHGMYIKQQYLVGINISRWHLIRKMRYEVAVVR
jgi:hypothetical protein